MYMLPQPQLQTLPPYVHFQEVFTPEECARICLMGNEMKPAQVGGGVVDPKIRISETSWIHWSKEADWLFARLARVVAQVQQNWYPFSLAGFIEPLQLTKYSAEQGGHYDFHKDHGDAPIGTRKLSLCCLLTPREEFKGGELDLAAIVGPDKTAKEMTQGAMIAFPSWELHRIRPVTNGCRMSLVAWVGGHHFV